MTTVLKCLETPAIGSTVSEQAGPEAKGYTRCKSFMHQAVAIYPQNVTQCDKMCHRPLFINISVFMIITLVYQACQRLSEILKHRWF